MKTIILLLVAVLLSIETQSQVHQEWVQRYDGPTNGNESGYAIAVDNSNNVYVTGSTSVSGGSSDFITIKYNTAGAVQWIRQYDGPEGYDDFARSNTVDASGNVYVAGRVGGTNWYDFGLLKYNSAGILQWVQRYNGPANLDDEATCVKTDNAGNVYVTGQSKGSNQNFNYTTIKYNSTGDQQWIQRYTETGNCNSFATSMTIDDNNNAIITGNTCSIITTIKYSPSGAEQWVRKYIGSGTATGTANAIGKDVLGNVFVGGIIYHDGPSIYNDYLTLKYNSSGVLQWAQTYAGPISSTDQINALTVDNAGNVIETGYSYTSGGNADYATVKYNTDGVQQWVRKYDGPANFYDEPFSITADNSGNVYVTGMSSDIGSNYDYATIKYNSNGMEQWIQRYDGTANATDDAFGIAVDNSGGVYVTGASSGIGQNSDIVTIKYSQPDGVSQMSNEIPKNFKLEQNYPNPFNPKTVIDFSLPKSSSVRLVVFDILGREIETLINEDLAAGIYKTEFAADKYSSGIYYYRLTTPENSDTKKMMLIR